MELSIENIFFFMAIMLGIAVIMWTIVAVITKKNEHENNAQPIKSETVKLVDMQQVNNGLTNTVRAIFELQDGQRMALMVNPQNTLVVGDIGKLTWQGNKILKFERTESNMGKV